MPLPRFPRIAALQCGLALSGSALIVLTPPAIGTMILVPIRPATLAATANLALAHGARLIASGPLPGSLVVRGNRDALATAAARSGILLLAAPFSACGSPEGGGVS